MTGENTEMRLHIVVDQSSTAKYRLQHQNNKYQNKLFVINKREKLMTQVQKNPNIS